MTITASASAKTNRVSSPRTRALVAAVAALSLPVASSVPGWFRNRYHGKNGPTAITRISGTMKGRKVASK